MPTRSVAPDDAPFGVLPIDLERHQTPVRPAGTMIVSASSEASTSSSRHCAAMR